MTELFSQSDTVPAKALDSLNPEQARAAAHRGSPLIVLAGPGTGKTRVIIARILHLIESGVAPEKILAVTYTNKAAREMSERLASQGQPRTTEGTGVSCSTLHALGQRLIRRFGDMMGVPSDPVIVDSAVIRRRLLAVVRERSLFQWRAAQGVESLVPMLDAFVGACRNADRSPTDALAYAKQWGGELDRNDKALDDAALEAERVRQRFFADAASAYEGLEDAMLRAGELSFDHLIALPTQLLRSPRGKLAAIVLRDEIRHIVVDEFQDLNAAQIAFIRALAPPERDTDICVVGDDDQSIYAFRGADPQAFERFASQWTNATTIRLRTNYRSRAGILRAAATIIGIADDRFDPEKEIVAHDPENQPDAVLRAVMLSDDAHSGAVAAKIIRDGVEHHGASFQSYGIICATHATADAVAGELRLQGIPVSRQRKLTPADDLAVQDLLAWVRLLVYPIDSTHAAQRLLLRPPQSDGNRVLLQRVSKLLSGYRKAADYGGYEQGVVEWLRANAGDEPSVRLLLSHWDELVEHATIEAADAALHRILRTTGLAYADGVVGDDRDLRFANLVQILAFVSERMRVMEQPANLASFLSHYDALTRKEQQFDAGGSRLDPDEDDEAEATDQPGEVAVLTAHASKGLEFDRVIICKVRPRGFPAVERPDDRADLPDDFTQTPSPAFANEQRRLFYVALTRARHEVTLLAKSKKGKSTGASGDYTIELTHDNDLGFVEYSEDELLADDTGIIPESALAESIGAASSSGAEAIVLHEMAKSRQTLASAVHRLSALPAQGEALESALREIEDAARSVNDLAAIRTALAHNEPLPQGTTATAHLLERVERARRGSAIPPLLAPIKLSYSMINQYNRCGRCFAAKFVLGVPDIVSSYAQVGTIVHNLLERHYKALRAAESDGHKPPTLETLLADAKQAWLASDAPDPAILEQVVGQLTNALEMGDPHDQVLHIEQVINMPYSVDGVDHTLTAKIDRIDQLDGGLLRIVDYKTGKGSKDQRTPTKTDLQMGIYAMALAYSQGDDPMGDDMPHGVAEYWLLSSAQRGTIGLDALNLTKVRDNINDAVRGMLAGRYEKGGDWTCSGLCAILPPMPIKPTIP